MVSEVPIGDDDAPLETEKAHEVCWKAVDACGGLKHGTKYAARTCVALLEKLLRQGVFPSRETTPTVKMCYDSWQRVKEDASPTVNRAAAARGCINGLFERAGAAVPTAAASN